MKALKQHILERLILSKTHKIPDGEFNINWATDSINKFKDYYKAMNEKHGFKLPDIAMTAKFRPIDVVYYDKFDSSDSDQNAIEFIIYKITENIKFSKLYDIIIKYFEDNTDLLSESLNERLVLSKNRNYLENDKIKIVPPCLVKEFILSVTTENDTKKLGQNLLILYHGDPSYPYCNKISIILSYIYVKKKTNFSHLWVKFRKFFLRIQRVPPKRHPVKLLYITECFVKHSVCQYAKDIKRYRLIVLISRKNIK